MRRTAGTPDIGTIPFRIYFETFQIGLSDNKSDGLLA